MLNRKLVLIISIIFILSTSCSLFGLDTNSSGQNERVQKVNAGEGANLELENGAALNIPPGSLPGDQEVSIRMVEVKEKESKISDEFSPAGSLYEISFGGVTLAEPAEITLPYNPDILPEDVTPEMLFIAYFDETQQEWIYAGGEVDQDEQVIRIQTRHASRWSIFYWNWDAWIAVLSKTLGGSWVGLIESVQLLTNDCPQKSPSVSVINVSRQNLIQGCIESEDGTSAQVRVVNPKSFYYEVIAKSADQGVIVSKMLAPGEDYEFTIDTREKSPLSVTAEITQAAGYRLVIHLVLSMLPGFTTIANQPEAVACLTERLHDVAYFASAAEALSAMGDHSGLKAGESIVKFLEDQDAVRRFLSASDDCIPGLAKTWSSKMKLIAKLSGVIISSTDYIVTTLAMLFAGETNAQVDFQWSPMAVDLTDPQSIVNWVKYILKTGDITLFNDLIMGDDLLYGQYLEGGQIVTKYQFLNHLQERISPQPACLGVDLQASSLFIWYEDWQPAWQMTEFCYAECNPLIPPWESETAAFVFKVVPESGKYSFFGMYQNTPENYYFEDGYNLISCDTEQPLVGLTPGSRCPGSPPQRLQAGEKGEVCTKKDGVYLRKSPGIESEKIVLLGPGTGFTILAGPECAGNNWSWWKVELDDGQVGWIAEGGDVYDQYFLCPVE